MSTKDTLELFGDSGYRDALWIRALMKKHPGRVIRSNCADRKEAESIARHLTTEERPMVLLMYRYHKTWRLFER
jgi:hypothetical protein